MIKIMDGAGEKSLASLFYFEHSNSDHDQLELVIIILVTDSRARFYQYHSIVYSIVFVFSKQGSIG